jgi:hypothetical protein
LQEAAESVLDNRGMAISVFPPTATLPPFGTARFTLKLMSNMIGTYEDILECTVGAESAQRFLIRAGIIGSPVHLQKEASMIKGLFVSNCTHTRVNFGVVPKGVQVTRSVSVFNLSSFEVAIAFNLEVLERHPQHAWTTSQLHVLPDNTVELTIRYFRSRLLFTNATLSVELRCTLQSVATQAWHSLSDCLKQQLSSTQSCTWIYDWFLQAQYTGTLRSTIHTPASSVLYQNGTFLGDTIICISQTGCKRAYHHHVCL